MRDHITVYAWSLQSRVEKLGCVSVVRLEKMLLYSAGFVVGENFQAGPAWQWGCAGMSAVSTVRYQAKLVKKAPVYW